MRHLGFWATTVAIGVFVGAPLLLLVLNSFRNVELGDLGFRLSALTLDNYVEAYSNPATYRVLLNSLYYAFGSTIVALVLGGTLAFLAERTDLGFRGLLTTMAVVPLAIPGIVSAMAWTLLLAPGVGLINNLWQGLFGHALASAYSLPVMVWVEGTAMSMLAFLLVSASLRQMDPSLEDAATMSGASPAKVLLRIDLPLLLPAFAGLMMLLFIRGMESFEIPMVLGFNERIFVFATSIYYELRQAYPPEYGLGFAYSITLVLLAVGAVALYQRQLWSARRYVTVTGRGFRPHPVSLGGWRPLAWVFVICYGIFVVLLPILILVWSSLLGFYRQPSLEAISRVSLANYGQILGHPSFNTALGNTFLLAAATTLAIMSIAVIVSWLVYRTGVKWRRLLDFIVFAPYAFPGIAVGVAFMILFLSFPNPIYNTIWIIVLAYCVSFLPIGTRFTHAAMVQIHGELEEAAWMSGASFWRTLIRVWTPLLKPALLNGGLFLVILSFKALSIATLLQGPDSLILPVFLWNLWDRGGALGPASALAVLLVLIVSVFAVVSLRLGRGPAHEIHAVR